MRLGRRWAVVGVILGGLGILSAVLGWSRWEAWPARLVINPPEKSFPIGFAADGRSFQTSSRSGTTSWDVATGRPLGSPSEPVIWRRSYSSDRRSFVGWIGNDFGVAEVVWGDASPEAIKRRFTVRAVQANHLALVDGGRSIQAVLIDRKEGVEVATWDIASGAEVRQAIEGPGPGHTRRPVAFSADGRVWAYLNKSQNAIQLWDAEADQALGGLLRTRSTQRNLVGWEWTGVAFSPDGRTVLASRDDGQVEFSDVGDAHLIKVVKVHPGGSTAMQLHFSPDGRTLISTGSIFRSQSPLAQVWAYLRTLATNSPTKWDDSLETVVLDLATDRVVARSRGSAFTGFSPDGRKVANLESNGTISVRDVPQPSAR